MKINQISSPFNSVLKRIRALHERKFREQQRQFLIEGTRIIDEAFQKGLSVHDVLVSESFLNNSPQAVASLNLDAISVVEDMLFKEVSTTVTPSGILAIADMPSYSFENIFAGDKTLVVVAGAIQDPGNLGTMIRTALAACASGMVLVKGTVDPFNPKVVRSAMGALFALPVVWDVSLNDTIDKLRLYGARIVACDASAPNSLFDSDLRGPLALLFGNEGNGFASGELQLADEIVSIPMNPQSESLNAAISAAIVLFNIVQQRLKL